MLRWFIIICGLISLFILRFYSINNEVRARMIAAVNEMKEKQV